MGLFDRYDTRDGLLEAVAELVKSERDEESGKEEFYLEPDPESGVMMSEQLETERAMAEEYEKRWKESESVLKEVRNENARLLATNEEFSKFNPEKQRDEINRLLEEVGRLKADNRELTGMIEPLNQVIADYKSKEDERLIEKALIDEAAKLGVRPEAMRDVMFRRSMLCVSDLGTVQTQDGVNVAEFMKSEFDASPLWHPLSAGGGSQPGKSGNTPSGELYREAVEKRDFEGMIQNAPEFKGVTLS